MLKYLLSGVVALALSAFAFAGPHHGHPGHGHPGHARPGHVNPGRVNPGHVHPGYHNPGYHHQHGCRFHHGWYYQGRYHHHWLSYRWHSYYRCWVFYDGGLGVWYYYCYPMNCYYPISYCPYNTYYWANCDFCNPGCCPQR